MTTATRIKRGRMKFLGLLKDVCPFLQPPQTLALQATLLRISTAVASRRLPCWETAPWRVTD